MKKHEVLIIESRGAQDHFDDRYEAATLKNVLKLQGITAKHVEVVNKAFLTKAIKLAASEHIKYVHISAHGSPEGFELTSGEFITWEAFDRIGWQHLKDTCLCFSSCNVGQGAHELFSYHKTFCNAIVAPSRAIDWDEGLVAYSAFYHRATKSATSTAQDVKVLNHIVGAGTFKLIESPTRAVTYAVGA